MKKILLFVLSTMSILISCSKNNERYPWGRDTEVYIGDGRFQIFRVYDYEHPADYYDSNIEPKCYYCVNDSETMESIEDDIYKYYDDGKNLLFLSGSNGYTVIDYKSAVWIQHEEVEEFEDKYKKIFLQSWKFKDLD